ncbi:MAG TPA: hypothetical protein VHW72_14495, partial [Candidatus Angelobacter sp.]|nr:hypothetical protein [Candidatus Angelobacter sp.]
QRQKSTDEKAISTRRRGSARLTTLQNVKDDYPWFNSRQKEWFFSILNEAAKRISHKICFCVQQFFARPHFATRQNAKARSFQSPRFSKNHSR